MRRTGGGQIRLCLPAFAFLLFATMAEAQLPALQPSSGNAGSSLDVAITGAVYAPEDVTISFQPGGLTARNLRLAGRQLTFTLDISSGAPAEMYLLVLTPSARATAGGAGPVVVRDAFRVIRPVRVTSVTPAQITAGTSMNVTITGSGFLRPEVRFTGPGITSDGKTSNDTTITATLTAAPGAALGPQSFYVENRDGGSSRAQSPLPVITVVAPAPVRTPPLVTSITPESAAQGGSLLVRIAGTGFQTGASVKLGTGVSANVMSVAAGEIVASVLVAADAPPGSRRVVVRNPDGLTNEAQPRPIDFTITATATRTLPPPAPPAPPIVTSITPASAAQGASLMVRIAGSGFQTGASVKLGNGVSANVLSVTPGEIVANVGVAADAPPGAHRVVVRNPDGLTNESQPRPVDLTITATTRAPPPPPPPLGRTPPVVTSIAPSSAEQGASALARIAGSGFQTGASVSLGNGVSATVMTVTPGEIVANLRVATDATPGAHRVIVRNPDGLTNESQPRPVDLTITAARAVAPPPAPRKVLIVTSIAPSSVEQGASPLVRIAGSGFQSGATLNLGSGVTATVISATESEIVAALVVAASAPPGAHRVVVRNPDGLTNETQAQPVDLTITSLKVVVKPPPIVLPPLTSVKGPRVDSMKPQTVTPGNNYMLDIDGKNFSPDMKITLGKDITILGVPMVLSPTKAKLQVLVQTAATQGVVAAVASSPSGQNTGPGGVMIGSALKKASPPTKKATVPEKPPMTTVKEPTGEIKLLHPCHEAYDSGCDEVPTIDDGTKFDWKELTPGIAQVFVFEIINAKENVLYSAQTSIPLLEWNGSKLAALFEKIAAPKQGTGGTAGIAPVGSGSGSSGAIGAGAPNLANTGSASGGAQGQGGGMPNKPKSNFQMLLSSYPDAVFWRVRGLRAKIGKPKEMYVAEESDARPLSLPQPPNGFSCPVSSSKIGFVPVPDDQYASAPCDGQFSTKLCSGMKARFSETSTLDLTKVPFKITQLGDFGPEGNPVVQYSNVFVDWGDGSEPSSLFVSGTLSESLANAKVLTFAHEHKYVNADTSSEHHDYSVRIYAVAGDSKSSLLDLAKAAQESASSGGAKGVKDVHTLACMKVRVWNQVDLTKEMPLTLVSALTVFPADWSKALAAVKAGVDSNDIQLVDGSGLNTGGFNEVKSPSGGGNTVQAGGVVGAGNPGPGTKAAPSGPLTSKISTYGIDTSAMSKVSECSEAFRPFVRIQYWGRGRARIRWTLDGKVIEEYETPELPPVTYTDAMNGKQPYDIDLTIPLPSKFKSGSNVHTLKVHVETGKPPASMASATGSAPAPTGMIGMTPGPAQLVSSTVTPVSGGGSLPGVPIPGTGSLKVFDAGSGSSMEGPYSAVDAKRSYEVVKKLPDVPCRIIYQTVKSGTLYITDITGFQLDKGSSSGKGKLKIVLPGANGSTATYADVVFNKWKLQPRPGVETDFDALSGNLSVKTSAGGSAMNFPVRFTAVSLNPERLLVSGAASLPAGNLAPELDKMPEWPFTEVVMGPGGRFAFVSSGAKKTVVLGESQFKLDITAIEFDFNFIKPPANACSKTSFSGALVSGLLRAPQAVTFGKSPILADVDVEKWAVTPKGLSVQLADAPFGTTVTESAVTITTSDVSFDSCAGGFATKFLLAINGIKFFNEGIKGDGSLDAQANLLVAIQPAAAAKNWTNADIEVSSLSLHRENGKNWYFLANGSFAFRSLGKPFQKVQYEKMTLGFDGKLLLPLQSVNNVEKTTTNLAGFPYTITKFNASNSGSALTFTFTGDIKFGEKVKPATNRDVTFSLPYKSASLSDRPATLLADMPLFDEGPVALLTAPPDEGGGGQDEPEVQAVDIDLAFPEGVGSVRIKAKCAWTSTATGYRFTTDDGTISVIDSLEIQQTRFVFGNDNGESYWLAQASLKLPTPIQLGATPLYLFSIGGGIGHNVDIKSFNAPVEDVVAAHSSNYLFSADADIGTLTDGEIFWSNARVTVQPNDGFAVRADLKAWLLTDDHNQAPTGVGYMMYSGGAFSAGFDVHYVQGGGTLVIDASAAMYFAGTNDFYIHLGTPAAPVSAKVVGVKGSGWVAAGSSGASFNFVLHYEDEVSKDIEICTAHAGYEFYWGMGAGLGFDPFSISASATAGVGVNAGCGVFEVGAGADVTLSVTLPGSPKLCGTLHVFVEVLGKKYYLIDTGEFCV